MTDSVGSSSLSVARVLLQGREILDGAALGEKVDKTTVAQALHSCKEAMVICEKALARVAGRVDAIVAEIQATGVKRDSRGRALNPLPQVPDLDADVTLFLIHAKRAIYFICQLPSMFLPVPPKDNNFDDLGKTLERSVGTDAHVTGFVLANAPGVRYLIELRNYQEHPGGKRTIVDNFAVLPAGTIALPMWYLSGETPRPIGEEMRAAMQFLVEMAEAMLIHLVMHAVDKRFPFIIQEYDASQIDAKKPIKYRLSIDMSKLRTGAGPPGA